MPVAPTTQAPSDMTRRVRAGIARAKANQTIFTRSEALFQVLGAHPAKTREKYGFWVSFGPFDFDAGMYADSRIMSEFVGRSLQRWQ